LPSCVTGAVLEGLRLNHALGYPGTWGEGWWWRHVQVLSGTSTMQGKFYALLFPKLTWRPSS